MTGNNLNENEYDSIKDKAALIGQLLDVIDDVSEVSYSNVGIVRISTKSNEASERLFDVLKKLIPHSEVVDCTIKVTQPKIVPVDKPYSASPCFFNWTHDGVLPS